MAVTDSLVDFGLSNVDRTRLRTAQRRVISQPMSSISRPADPRVLAKSYSTTDN